MIRVKEGEVLISTYGITIHELHSAGIYHVHIWTETALLNLEHQIARNAQYSTRFGNPAKHILFE